MPLLVDVNNVMHTTGVLPRELALDGLGDLITLIQRSRYGHDRIELIIDSGSRPPPDSTVGNISVRYSGGAQSADDVIADMVRSIANPRSVTVVSSDRGVLKSARTRQCRRVKSEVFLGNLALDALWAQRSPRPVAVSRPRAPLSPDKIRGWLAYFNISEEEIDALVREETIRPRSSESGTEVFPDAIAPAEPIDDHPFREIDAAELIPPDVIAQAERLWRNQRPV